jgi:hypothetical protein
MKGDQITVMLRTGDSTVTNTVSASKSGRTVSANVEKQANVNWLVVTEYTRGGTITHESKYQLTDVVMWEKRTE